MPSISNSHTVVEISNLYEVDVKHSDDPTDVDMKAYRNTRSAHMLPVGVPISTEQHVEDEAEDPEPRPVTELMPELAAIDAALRSSLGFGIDAITGVLNVETQHDATRDRPATVTTPYLFVQQCDIYSSSSATTWQSVRPPTNTGRPSTG